MSLWKESVKAKVLVKNFFEAAGGLLTPWGRLPEEDVGKGKDISVPTSLSGGEEWQCPAWNECWDAGLKHWKEFSQGIEREQGKVLFHMTSYKWVRCLFCACSVLSCSKSTRVLSTASLKWKWLCPLLWNANYFRNVPGSCGFLKLTLLRFFFFSVFGCVGRWYFNCFS